MAGLTLTYEPTPATVPSEAAEATEMVDPIAMESLYSEFDPSEFDFLFTANAAFGS